MNISELKVMESAAGFYLGRSYYDDECNADRPYSRQSGYFKCTEEASKALRLYPTNRRDCHENQLLYLKEDLMDNPKMPMKD